MQSILKTSLSPAHIMHVFVVRSRILAKDSVDKPTIDVAMDKQSDEVFDESQLSEDAEVIAKFIQETEVSRGE